MVTLEYFNGSEWVFVDKYPSNHIAWIALGDDFDNYRTINEFGEVIMER
ncbi:MAG: hypothetical protein AAF348_11515 [Bacteroidota bacterium]